MHYWLSPLVLSGLLLYCGIVQYYGTGSGIMSLDEIKNIITQGVPRIKSKEAIERIGVLQRFFKQHTGKTVPCGWCERALIYRHVKVLIERMENEKD